MKSTFSLLVIFSLWTGLLTPFSLAQNSNTASADQEIAEEKKGLEFRVREGQPDLPKPTPTPVSASKLNAPEADAILERLPEMPKEAETEEFKLRENSLPPPKSGTLLNVKFPADENLPSPKTNVPPGLEVVRFTPQGNVSLAPELTVSFSQPMIAVTSQTEASENVPVQLTPAVKGRWRWLGTNTLTFKAEPRFPMATEFTAKIPAGTKSAAGGTLAKDLIWKFTTPAPKVEFFAANAQNVRRDAILIANFDQEIDPPAVLPKLIARAGSQKIPLRLATETELAANEAVANSVKKLQPGRWMAFRAVELFPADANINVSFEIGTPSAEGPLTTREAQSFYFRTFGSLKLNRAVCGYNQPIIACSPSSQWELRFNNRLDAKNFDKSLIKIEPPVEAEFNIYGNELNINAQVKSRSKYKVTVSKNLRDEFGQTLGEDLFPEFITSAADQALSSQHYRDFITLDPNARPVFAVYSTNYNSLKVRIYSVKPEDFQSFLDFQHFNEDKVSYPSLGKLVFNQTVKVKNIPDESVDTLINLAPFLKKGIGHAVLIVEPIEPKKGVERIVKWLQATQIGLDAFGDHDSLTVYTSQLKSGKPLGQVLLSLTNMTSAASGENGLASLRLPPKKDEESNFLIARNGDDSAILPNGEYYYYDSQGGWFASPSEDNLRWFIFDDRQMYRPHETVSVKGYLRRKTGGKLSDISELADSVTNVSYVLRDPKNNEITRGTAQLNAFGAFDFQLKLPGNINLGQQTLELQAVGHSGKNSFTHNFRVQEFRRPEFEVSARVESAAPFYVGDSANLLTEAKYYSGGGLANAAASWEIVAKPTNYSPPNHDDFTFGKFEPWWSHDSGEYGYWSRQQYRGQTDIEGQHRIALDFLKANPARPYSIEAESTVQDVNRQAFAGKASLLVHPAKLYVGLRSAKTFVQAGETFKIETITTDLDGNPAVDAPLTLKAELKDWQQVKGEWQEVVIDTQKCEVKSAKEIVSCDFTAKQGGTYTVTARVLDEKERPNESELTIWVAGGNREKSTGVEAQEIELIPDKKEYAPDETAEILLNAPFYPAEGVLLLERNGVVKTERFTLEKSSTVLKIPIEEGYLPNFHVGVTLLGAQSLEIYGDERDKEIPKAPAFAIGNLNLNVSTASRKLKVTAEPLSKILTPGGQTKINLAVTDNNGRAVPNSEVALVAVDESILALTGYKISNPLDVFYEQIEAHVDGSHSRRNIMLSGFGYEGGSGMGSGDGAGVGDVSNASPVILRSEELASLPDDPAELEKALRTMARSPDSAKMSIDGFSGGKMPNNSPQAIQLRRNFAALAIFAPSVKTDENGQAVVDLKLPDNLTRYRISAVAVTRSKQFGLGESNVTAKQPLMVRPSAPRFMNFGDRAELPVVLQNQTDSPMTVEVVIRSSNAALTDGNGRKVTVPANDRAEIRFPVKTEKAGIARFQIGAASDKFADAAEIQFPVYTPATGEAFATYGTTEQNGAIIQPVSAPKDVYSEFGGLEITASSTQLQELTDAFIYLQNYPFECSEQISSRMLSVAALREVLTAFKAKELPGKEQIEAKMKSDIERLRNLQHEDGGFSFWRKDDDSFPYISIHAAHALARAKAKGYPLPQPMINKSLAYLSNIEAKFPRWYSQEARWTLSAYSYYVRDLLNERSAASQARQLLQTATPEKLSPEALGWILSVLAGDKNSTVQVEQIRRHLLNRMTETASTAHFASSYKDGEYVLLHSDRRADGVILEALLRVERQEARDAGADTNPKSEIRNPKPEDGLIPKLVRGLLANRTKGRWQSTQENAFVLLALDKYFQTFEKTTPNFVAQVWLGNAYAGEQKFVGRTTDSGLIKVPMNYLQTSNNSQNLILDKQGEGRLYYRIGLTYAPKNLRLKPADYGFAVSRSYEAVDNPADVRRHGDGRWTIRAGARVRVRVQMVNQSDRYHVALVDNLPAGIEIINPDLAVSGSVKEDNEPPAIRHYGTWFDHQNLRDHRAEAFQDLLYAGVYQYTYVGRATTIGEFVVPPAKAEEMYAPETFGRSATDLVKIE